MKKLIILLLIPIFSFSQSSFSDGYKSGYKKGYCLEDVGCISPIPPIAPIPAPGYNTYSDGYARGVQDGQKKRQAKNLTNSSNSGAYQNPKSFTPTSTSSFQNDLNKMNNDIIRSMQAMYANLDQRGTSTYFPNPKKNKKPFKKLNVFLKKGFGSLNIPLDDAGGSDKMFLGQKLFKGLKGKNILVSPYSPYKVTFQYKYRADTGCGGVVFNKLQMYITDERNNERISSVSFSQSSFEGKCIDNVIFQTIERLIGLNTEFDLGEYENEINQPKTQISPSSTDNEKIYSQLKKLKELLDLDILTKEEFDKKANELKKLILD